jgi:hypothetical protein
MFVFRRIAAADMPTAQAQPKMNPRLAHFQTLLAPSAARDDILDLIRMRAFLHSITLWIGTARFALSEGRAAGPMNHLW